MIEAIYIFDEHNNLILEHVYSGRPLNATSLLRQYLSTQPPRPSLISLPNIFPATLVHSIIHDRQLFLCSSTADVEPLVALEFLYRLADALEDFLGAPLVASKIEASYDVAAQIIGEICDAGTISTTEPDALKEAVEVPSAMGSFLGGFGLPSTPPALSSRSSATGALSLGLSNTSTTSAGSAIPWRRSNVRHTSNELYVDIIEQISTIFAPSGRPISAIVNGSIVFTAKISGIPDLRLSLSAPGGKAGIEHAMSLPTFHPCVRLARWRERPGELSFVPPDGRFVLAGYECDLLPNILTTDPHLDSNLDLPVSLQIKPHMGHGGEEFEATLQINRVQKTSSSTASSTFGSRNTNGRLGTSSPAFGASANTTGGSNVAAIEEILVAIPLPVNVRNVTDIRPSKGEAHFVPAESCVEWRISSREAAAIPSYGAVLRCSVVGLTDPGDEKAGLKLKTDTFDYDETSAIHTGHDEANGDEESREARWQRNATLMPRSANVSFNIKGWLASGIKVEALEVNVKASKGLGAGVQPYKGVKYHSISRQGIEVRC